jgi:hypothetical protein
MVVTFLDLVLTHMLAFLFDAVFTLLSELVFSLPQSFFLCFSLCFYSSNCKTHFNSMEKFPFSVSSMKYQQRMPTVQLLSFFSLLLLFLVDLYLKTCRHHHRGEGKHTILSLLFSSKTNWAYAYTLTVVIFVVDVIFSRNLSFFL